MNVMVGTRNEKSKLKRDMLHVSGVLGLLSAGMPCLLVDGLLSRFLLSNERNGNIISCLSVLLVKTVAATNSDV
jgi:hypothetical protein